jgi:hypothetical protein
MLICDVFVLDAVNSLAPKFEEKSKQMDGK